MIVVLLPEMARAGTAAPLASVSFVSALVLIGFVMAVTVTAATGVPAGIFVSVMLVMFVCVMSTAASLMFMFMLVLVPVFSAGNAVP